VVVLVQLDRMFQLYTWFPYQSYQYYDSISNIVLMNQWGLENNAIITADRDLFPNEVL
jgi:hypothetical protein